MTCQLMDFPHLLPYLLIFNASVLLKADVQVVEFGYFCLYYIFMSFAIVLVINTHAVM